MRTSSRGWRARTKFTLLCGGMVLSHAFALGGCDLGTISTTTTATLDGRQVLIDLLRGAILTPIDAAITNAVENLLGDDEDE